MRRSASINHPAPETNRNKRSSPSAPPKPPKDSPMDLLVTLSLIVFVNLVGWITPGPNMFAVISAALTGGRRNGVMTGLGLSTGAVIWTLLAVLGVATLFELFPAFVFWLRMAGATYLIWLGLKALRSAWDVGSDVATERPDFDAAAPSAEKNHRGLRQAYLTGLLVSLTNPKAAFFFGSILTAFVPATASPALLAGIVLLCGALAVICHSVTATVFSTKIIARGFQRARRAITAAFGFVFAGLGLGVAYDAVRRL